MPETAIGKAHSVVRPAISYILRYFVGLGRDCAVGFWVRLIYREYLDRLDDVFQFLWTEASERESELSIDLIMHVAGKL